MYRVISCISPGLNPQACTNYVSSRVRFANMPWTGYNSSWSQELVWSSLKFSKLKLCVPLPNSGTENSCVRPDMKRPCVSDPKMKEEMKSTFDIAEYWAKLDRTTRSKAPKCLSRTDERPK
jgi:hypothetical protein